MQRYFLHRNNANHGPYPVEQLQQMVAAGQVGAGEMVCAEGTTQWLPAGSLMGGAPAPGAAAAPAAGYAQPGVYASGQPGVAGQQMMIGAKPKLGLVLGWVWLYAIGFWVAAIWCYFEFSNLVHQETGEKAGPVTGLMMFGLIGIFATLFTITAIGLTKRKPWGHRLGTGFLFVHIFSPLIPLAWIGLKRMEAPETLAAFGAR